MNATLTETEPILIARTNKKERLSVNHGQVWWEYRIRHLEQHERPADGPDWGSEWALEQRRCEDGDAAKEHDWIVYNYGNTPEKTIGGVMSNILSEANSLHALHADAVSHFKHLRLLQIDTQKANLAAAQAERALEAFKDARNEEFHKKAAKIDDKEKQDTLFATMKAKHKPEFLRLKGLAAKADSDNQDAATRVDLHIDMEFDKEPISDTLRKLLDGGNAVVSENWMNTMAEQRHNICQYIRTCINRKTVGTKDRYVAWIFNTGKPDDLEMRPDHTGIGSASSI